jgi:hypothetical protein
MLRYVRRAALDLFQGFSLKKYGLYAIGEIILVVVGILIAVEVNNANNRRQRGVLEKSILREILTNIQDDKIDVADEIYSYQVVLHADSMLYRHVEQRLPYADSIGAYLQILQLSPHLTPGRNGYNLLESKGIDLILDDSLRIRVTNLYEREYPYYATYALERFRAIERLVQPYLAEHFVLERQQDWPFWRQVPIDYPNLLDDQRLFSVIQLSAYHADLMQSKASALMEEVGEVEQAIERYLARHP